MADATTTRHPHEIERWERADDPQTAALRLCVQALEALLAYEVTNYSRRDREILAAFFGTDNGHAWRYGAMRMEVERRIAAARAALGEQE